MIKGATPSIFSAIIWNQGNILLLMPNHHSTRQLRSVLLCMYLGFCLEDGQTYVKRSVFQGDECPQYHLAIMERHLTDLVWILPHKKKFPHSMKIQGDITPCYCAEGLGASNLSIMVASCLCYHEHIK